MNNAMGPQLLLQASAFARIGVTHLAWSNYEIFRQCYADYGPFEDYLKTTCRSSQLVSDLFQSSVLLSSSTTNVLGFSWRREVVMIKQ
jgi:hypothetical protein